MPARTITVTLDMSKAFDTINISTLNRKLLETNIPDTIIKLSASGCTPSLIGSSPTSVWPPSQALSLTMAGGAAKTVWRAIQFPRFSFGATFLRPNALPDVNHMRWMQYERVLNLTS